MERQPREQQRLLRVQDFCRQVFEDPPSVQLMEAASRRTALRRLGLPVDPSTAHAAAGSVSLFPPV